MRDEKDKIDDSAEEHVLISVVKRGGDWYPTLSKKDPEELLHAFVVLGIYLDVCLGEGKEKVLALLRESTLVGYESANKDV